MVERTQGPRYRSIATDLRQKIDNGVYEPGQKLPTEPELEELYGVSRNTVRLALNVLVNEGLILTQAGRGTFVRDRAMLTFTASADESHGSEHNPEYVSEMKAQRREPSGGEVQMRVLPAQGRVADRLHIKTETLVVMRQVIRQVDGAPALVQSSYYPFDIAQNTGLTSPHDIPRGTIALLEELGHKQAGIRDELLSRMPTPQESASLRLGSGVPVIEMYRTAYSEDRPIRLTHTIFPGDLFRLVYNIGDVSAQDREAETDD